MNKNPRVQIHAGLLEEEFLQEFRRAGLTWVLYACVAVGALLLLFLALPQLSNQYTAGAANLRAGMLAMVITLAVVVRRFPEASVRHYVTLVGSACVVTLAGVIALVAVRDFGSVAAAFTPLAPVLVGLFISYAFLRLPLLCISGICWFFSVAAVVLAPEGFVGDGQLRQFMYVGAMNVLGMILCRSIESRERELFIQRRRAESAQAELEERALAAEEAHMEKTRLLAAVSHDLRQPMMAATAYLTVLGNRVRRREFELAERQMEHLEGSLGLLETTLDHLLTAARYDSGTEPMRVELVEIAPILRQVSDTFGPDAAARGIELRVREPSERLLVTTDSTALWRVLMNLVSNAIKFTDGAGRAGRGVLVRAALIGDTCRIDVADTGVGIPAEHLDSVWQPFFQVANPERDRAKGLGLGLFLVKRTLDHLPEHRLALRSRAGRGARFSVFLPGTRLGESRVVRPARAPVSGADLEMLHGAYVLVLEDDHEARRAILTLLDDWGVVHSSGATLENLLADAASATRSADALISDYRLPGGRTGSECVGLVRAGLDDPMPAIIVTAESDLDRIRSGLPGDTRVLQKPFDPSAMAGLLCAAIRRARSVERDEMEVEPPAI